MRELIGGGAAALFLGLGVLLLTACSDPEGELFEGRARLAVDNRLGACLAVSLYTDETAEELIDFWGPLCEGQRDLPATPGEAVLVVWTSASRRVLRYETITLIEGETETVVIDPPALTLHVRGPGEGAVRSDGFDERTGIYCDTATATCEEPFEPGAFEVLVPVAYEGSAFVRWGGACSGSDPECPVGLDSNETVVAVFSTLDRACEGPEDCDGGEACVDGFCDAGECEGDGDCGGGLECLGGYCVPEAEGCDGDGDCPSGRSCRDGECVLDEVECEGDDECPAGQRCDGGECVFVHPGGCGPLPECPLGLECIDGECVFPPFEGIPCTPGDDCGPGRECNAGGFCSSLFLPCDEDPGVCETTFGPLFACGSYLYCSRDCARDEDCEPGQMCSPFGGCTDECGGDEHCSEGSDCAFGFCIPA